MIPEERSKIKVHHIRHVTSPVQSEFENFSISRTFNLFCFQNDTVKILKQVEDESARRMEHFLPTL